MADRDTKGDLYEHMLGKIATAGKNGQFRTQRHITKLMVEMTAPTLRCAHVHSMLVALLGEFGLSRGVSRR
jgi:type I restriction-modification system DNA methylase subunit